MQQSERGSFSKEEIGFEANRVDSSHIFLKIEEVQYLIFIGEKGSLCQWFVLIQFARSGGVIKLYVESQIKVTFILEHQ